MVRRVEAICLLLVMFACPLSAAAVEDSEPTSPTYQEYLDASKQATEYFLKLYTEIGDRVRRGEVLQKCGYKKEADELDARTRAVEKVMINKSIEEGVASKKLASNTAILIARESAISLFAGYRFGFGESFALTRDSLLARDYEDLCKAALRKAQEWQKEGRQLERTLREALVRLTATPYPVQRRDGVVAVALPLREPRGQGRGTYSVNPLHR